MRTTIDIPIQIKQQLSQEASRRNLKGFSQIIVEALEEYFQTKSSDRRSVVARLKGSMTKEGHKKSLKIIQEGRSQWRT